MTAEELLDVLLHVTFLTLFAIVLVRAVRRPRLANTYAALFFGLIALILSYSMIQGVAGDVGLLDVISPALLLSVPYPLLRLAHEYTTVPTAVLRLAEAGLVSAVLAVLIQRDELESGPLVTALVLYFVLTVSYASGRFIIAARNSQGVPRRRLESAAIASGFVALVILLVLPENVYPGGPWGSLGTISSVAGGLAYFIAFATPPMVRDAWQAPDLRRFISETAISSLDEAEHLQHVAEELERSVTRLMGGRAVLLTLTGDDNIFDAPSMGDTAEIDRVYVSPGTTVAYRAFHSQRAIFDARPERSDPANGAVYRELGAAGVLAAPITLGVRRFGVLTLLLERPPLFAEDDVRLLELLADQIAIVLRSRELLQEAREIADERESLKLKDDFLSAAAHDLKTPLTTVLAQAQLLHRFAVRDPESPPNVEGIERLIAEAQRMRRLVNDLLDASRGDQSGFVGDLALVDLAALSRDAAGAFGPRGRRIVIEAEPCVAVVDRERMAQVLENLLDNALKYSPDGGSVRLATGCDVEGPYLTVEDSGVGIPEGDQPYIFERFRRASSIDERRFSGLGLGLYLCKRIVEEHHGTISVTSHTGQGSTFTVRLPPPVSEGATRHG